MSQYEITVELDGHTYVLQPTLEAMQRIDRQFGGANGALNAVRSASFENTAAIIEAGANLKGTQAKEMRERLFRAGVVRVLDQGSRDDASIGVFVGWLYNPPWNQDTTEEDADQGEA